MNPARRTLRVTVSALALAGLVASGAAQLAGSAAAAGPAGGLPPAASHASIKAPPMASARWDDLVASAARHGRLAVTLGLGVDAVAEGYLDRAARDGQQARIAGADRAVDALLSGSGGSHFHPFREVPYATAVVTPGALRALQHSTLVTSAAENQSIGLTDPAPSAAPVGSSGNANLAQGWSLPREQATYAQSQGYTGSGQTVAVLDTGTDRNHPALYGKVVREACFSGYSAGLGSGSCPGGTTYASGTGAAAPCTYISDCGHGTSVATIAAGARGVGVASGASIIGVDVFRYNAATGKPGSDTGDQVWGMWYVYQQRSALRIASLNLSLGGGYAQTYCDSTIGSSFDAWVQTLRSVGVTTVVATGNNGYRGGISSPSCDSHVLSVGNTTLDTSSYDAVYTSSNSASIETMIAPGTSIYSGALHGQYLYWTGTSQATPAVAGSIAVLRQLKPSSTVDQVKTALTASGPWVSDGSGVWKRRLAVWDSLVYLYNH